MGRQCRSMQTTAIPRYEANERRNIGKMPSRLTETLL